MTKEQAIQAKGKWLSQCLEFGWDKSDLDGLSEVWDKFKDEYGNFRPHAKPLPSQESENLEQAAEAEAKRRYPEEINVEKSTARNQRKNQRLFIEGAKFGAAYVKGGEEIAERYAVELAQWILHRFHSTEYDKDILKWKWNQTLWSSQEMFERFMEEEYPDFVIPGASRPSIDIVDELRKANPYQYNSIHDYDKWRWNAYQTAVQKLKELLNAPSQSPQTPIDTEPEGIENLWNDFAIEYERLQRMEENDWEWNRKILMDQYHITRK